MTSSSTLLFAIFFVAVIVVLIVLVIRADHKKNTDGDRPEEILPMPHASGNTRVCIAGIGGPFDGRKFELDGSLTIGRQKGRCNICFPPDTKGVSGIHCKLHHAGSFIELIDLNSSCGTFVNGIAIAPNSPVLLHPGDRFSLGSETYTFVFCV